MRTAHQLDPDSLRNPATGEPYPLWAGSEPQEPDPRCFCGAMWGEEECLERQTMAGAMWELSEAWHRFVQAIRDAFPGR